MNWIQKSLEAAKIPNESNQNQKTQLSRTSETRWWARVRQRKIEKGYLVWSRGHQALNKNGETRGWIEIHPKLRVDAYKIEEEDQTRMVRPVGGQKST